LEAVAGVLIVAIILLIEKRVMKSDPLGAHTGAGFQIVNPHYPPILG
jgi:hypothetical protein